MSLLCSDVLADVVASFSSDTPNLERVRYTGGQQNAAGEMEGQTPVMFPFSALVTSAATKQNKERWGEVEVGSLQALIDARDYDDVEEEFKVGDEIRHKGLGKRYEIRATRAPDIDAEAPFFRFMMTEVKR